ncbi:type III restriction-modification system endonuclease [Candidatus Synechococcus spongiarum]|uniref:Type III restriction enzyme, res subunit:DEAD/DEAH box helicase, N-terminal n=1 Tax=Candidatus Synechococcus spongiarum TaxID=431041 RepID=A0A165B3G6_9SYNE|nr:DEAD/DEAH box helicase family protein [Candidatus Synechococcus spongiarum]SAY39386.1 Type III restriction enzyme, res subunit:DEAD/DEAH box helicase, N-terminal [Candidatus Synechococcus spongiarum]
MKLKFKVQPYQTNAVNDVVDCFAGQPMLSGLTYLPHQPRPQAQTSLFEEGFKNADLTLTDVQLFENIQRVQRRQNLPMSQSLTDFTTFDNRGVRVPATATYKEDALTATRVHLDVEMETGTGKTYCYIKTIFEMNKCYGWSKFIIMVPSIAIREGVYKSLQITADHFTESYGKRARFFIYNSKRLHELENFSSDAGINVMVINIQAFNAQGADNRRIYEELDDFQSRRPIDVIASNRPILILDEPQKMEGWKTMKALPKFKPLFILRYSATHRTHHNRIHRLDALDAYNQKLVKKIVVCGIQTRGLAGANAYLYHEGIDISKTAPVARIEMEVKLESGEIKRQLRRLKFHDDLLVKSGELDQYRGYTISQIDAVDDTIEFTNGIVLRAGEANGDVSERDIRRIQIRETIKAHLDKEKQLFAKGIKVLSLFFIDKVVKYRDYNQANEKGEYARVFEEEYEMLKAEYLSELAINNNKYREYLAVTDPAKTHNGYFSIDKRTNRLKDPAARARSDDSDDVNAYDLILKDKERLLSFAEPIRFIFSHSALREGWDNPNVFVMCMLKHSDNTISRRQEVGRGLRLCVDQHGDRVDHPAVVHDVNVLTVVASESYRDFVAGLQKEIAEALSSRPRQATKQYFEGKILTTEYGPVKVTAAMANQIYRYLVKNDYTDDTDQIAGTYHEAKAAEKLADLPDELKPYAEQVFQLIDSVFSDAQLPKVDDSRKHKTNDLNTNFQKKEFKELWARINRKAVYRVEFDSVELIRKCVSALGSLRITPLQYTVQVGVQNDGLTDSQLRSGDGFTVTTTTTEHGDPIHFLVKYDLVGKVAEDAQLTRDTAATILHQIPSAIFEQFKKNPEHFISEVSRIIAEQKAVIVIEHLAYDEVDECYDVDIFTANQTSQNFYRATDKLNKHVYDYAITDSDIERDFVKELDTRNEVVVYAKLPRGFLIPTPVGDYNPDWAISFKAGSVRHIYFVAETKGTMSSMKLREIENKKIECARKFFEEISQRVTENRVRYDVVTGYDKLMELVNPAT